MAETRIPSLDGLRAVSIVLVVVGHAVKSRGHQPFLLRVLCLHAGLGVHVFFIVSGFLITTLLLQERAKHGNISLRLFYVRRALRIFPAAWLFLGCLAILNAWRVIQVAPQDWLYALTYTTNYTNPSCWQIGHLWSLSVEEQFYLAWPLLMRLANLQTCVAVAVAAVFSSIAFRAVWFVTGLHIINPNFDYAFPYQCGAIAMGCLLAIGVRQIRLLIEKLPIGLGLAIILPLVAVLDAVEWGSAYRFVEVAINLLLTVMVAMCVFSSECAVGRILNSRPLVWIGTLSYSLYLWQQLFLNPFSPTQRSWTYIPLIVGCAVMSYYTVEATLLKLRSCCRREKIEAQMECPQAAASR